MAESLSRLRNPRSEPRPEPKMATQTPPHVDEGAKPEGDHMHAAAESLHEADPSSKHMIISHDGYGVKSHGIDEQGKHEPEQGAHDHENIEALKQHMGQFFDEEEHEPSESGEEPEENQSLY